MPRLGKNNVASASNRLPPPHCLTLPFEGPASLPLSSYVVYGSVAPLFFFRLTCPDILFNTLTPSSLVKTQSTELFQSYSLSVLRVTSDDCISIYLWWRPSIRAVLSQIQFLQLNPKMSLIKVAWYGVSV